MKEYFKKLNVYPKCHLAGGLRGNDALKTSTGTKTSTIVSGLGFAEDQTALLNNDKEKKNRSFSTPAKQKAEAND